ncbi:MAG: chemotaxis protein CheW [Anaerolineales bacterium]|nr:chemotaxis protein CheW [Anaerolineales bacterium]
MENQIVVFELGLESYGVNIASVQSIIKLQPITQLPHAPGFVEGVTNLRGNVLPVIDLRKRFSLSAQKVGKHSRIMVVSIDQTEIGMIVDGVSEVLTVPEQAVEPAPTITTTIDSAFIAGIAKLDGSEGNQRLVILLDLEKIFSSQEQSLMKAVF